MANVAQPLAITQVSRYLEALENEKRPDEANKANHEARRELSEVKAYLREERT